MKRTFLHSFLYLFLCIPVRLLFIYILKKLDKKYNQIISLLLFIQSFTFIYLYLNNLRLKAPEGGGITWWHNSRLIHGVLYFASAVYTIQNKDIKFIP